MLQRFNEAKVFYENVRDLKESFAKKFNKKFQTDEITQLNKTIDWFSSFEADLIEFIDLQTKRNELDFDATNEMDDDELKEKINKIGVKYGLPPSA